MASLHKMVHMKEHTIDAENQSIGRIAQEAAWVLMGKDDPAYQRNETANVKVYITNTSKANIPSQKQTEKLYMSYSGYPSGRTDRPMEKIIREKGHGEVFRRAVYGMLPANRLRKRIMKNLIVEE